ncbi:hypothetical protein OK18_20655 [Chryseobacterium gallinarum]|uniref:Uncharacterized protein n=1 Tax=Chryseobacterium gallinarum TaxID=1324352 RepID=A0A0G3M6B1_CHRGL|nr:hypothetical protein [Chryseobacterium gallinarum]AKK74696.1 hypothetical protein OK18_20655 [Chryseobacterium gallinarum]MCL8538552.1 hypothetical protein [Chryseobacterium gallinarum]
MNKKNLTILGLLLYSLLFSQSVNTKPELAANNSSLITARLTDTDGDGIADDDDRDDDNDGIPDALECPGQFYWTGPVTFSAIDNNIATGTINGVGYTYTSSQPLGSTGNVFGYGNFPASYGVPNNNPTIKNTQATTNTLTFASPMTDPVLVFSSIGSGVLSVPIIFDKPIEIIWASAGNTLIVNSPTQITGREGYVILRIPGVHTSVSFNYTVAENWANFTFGATLPLPCDYDGDGIPNHLDLDSDNDGCVDAWEGDENVTVAQLVDAGGTATVGPGSIAPDKNICANASCVDSQGIPLLVNAGGAADSGGDQGQGIGSSQNINACSSCYKPGITGGAALDTKLGITVLGRAGSGNTDNWPMVRKGGWLALEAKTKGFVLNRVPFDTSGNPVGISPLNFVEGMTVYDATNNCLKIYTTKDNGTSFGWHCINIQTCPD